MLSGPFPAGCSVLGGEVSSDKLVPRVTTLSVNSGQNFTFAASLLRFQSLVLLKHEKMRILYKSSLKITFYTARMPFYVVNRKTKKLYLLLLLKSKQKMKYIAILRADVFLFLFW